MSSLNQIINFLTFTARHHFNNIEFFDSIDSTNTYLLKAKNIEKGKVVISNEQTNGRGRLGRQWFSPKGNNIYLSVMWEFNLPLHIFTGFSLFISSIVVSALKKQGFKEVGLKWPNDIFYHQQKVGGVLIETRLALSGAIQLIIGIGLNLALPDHIKANLGYGDLKITESALEKKNHLIAQLLNELIENLLIFPQIPFSNIINNWKKLDIYYLKQVDIFQAGKKIDTGINIGIDTKGNLRVLIDNRVHALKHSESSIRPTLN